MKQSMRATITRVGIVSGLMLVGGCSGSLFGGGGEANSCLAKEVEGQFTRAYNGCNVELNAMVCERFLTGREGCRSVAALPGETLYRIGNNNSGFLASMASPVSVNSFLCKAGYEIVWKDKENGVLGCEQSK